MADPFVGEIRIFAGNFAPRGWAFCDGQLLSVSENDALFSLIGTIYGGDGVSTFGLPDLRGRLPMHMGMGPGLSDRRLGQKLGAENITLTHIPPHSHAMIGSGDTANSAGLNDRVFAKVNSSSDEDLFYQENNPDNKINLIPGCVQNSGGSQPHSNLMPALCVNFIISLVGIYPSRS